MLFFGHANCGFHVFALSNDRKSSLKVVFVFIRQQDAELFLHFFCVVLHADELDLFIFEFLAELLDFVR